MHVITLRSKPSVVAGENPAISFMPYLPVDNLNLPGILSPRCCEFPPFTGLPMHDHDDPTHEILIPVRGKFLVVCDNGETATVKPGDWVISTPRQKTCRGQSHSGHSSPADHQHAYSYVGRGIRRLATA